jgi:hypothetical protein
MTEQTITQATGDKAALGFRSHLLTPVVAGNTLESDDVCSFLAGRLSAEDEEDEDEQARTGRWWVGYPVS